MINSTMISQIAASNPYVGVALGSASNDSGLLQTLAQNSTGGNEGLYGALGMQMMGASLIPPVTAAAALQSASPFSAALSTAQDEGAVDLEEEQGAQAGGLLDSLAGLGQNVDTYA